ncbi:helix-turn-helix domain-containing protein [Corynebacterium oculi]|uniref:helix-turn-helix domain-containing protein n=1 Tax=Corynebacterium oculi TaxID=1544416 RepID=UPI0006D8BFA5|nr:helix-turn-helix domain-containing protein [Corynebacterium oculi]
MRHLDLIGTTEAAKILHQTRTTIARRVASGDLHPVGSIGPRKIHVFDRAEIERIANEETPTPEGMRAR